MIAKITPSDDKKRLPKNLALAVNTNSIHVVGYPGKQVALEWTLKNESDVKWPKKGIYLRNHREQEGLIRYISIQERLEPGESCTLSVITKIPADTKGIDSVTFQFRFEEAEAQLDSFGKPMRSYFGETLIAYINIGRSPLVFS